MNVKYIYQKVKPKNTFFMQVGTETHPFIEVADFPPDGMSLTRWVRKMFTRGTYERVDCADRSCGKEEIKRSVFNLESNNPLIFVNLNRVTTNRDQSQVQLNTNPVKIGGLLKLPKGSSQVRYRIIGKLS